jgi:hypothetical protein
MSLHILTAWVEREIAMCVKALLAAFERFIPMSLADINSRDEFIQFPQVFAIVDASPIVVTQPIVHQEQYYSGKFKRHCVKAQAFVTPDGRCVDCQLWSAEPLTTKPSSTDRALQTSLHSVTIKNENIKR